MPKNLIEKLDWHEYYGPQEALKEIGPGGQEKLKSSSATIVGLGALGCVSSSYLALAGVGHLKLIDQDTVEARNLHRQPLYTPDDLYESKAEVAANRLQQLSPWLKVEPIPESLNGENARELIQGTSIIVDGLDNMASRYAVNKACVDLGIPLVFAGAIGFEGNIAMFSPKETACLECAFPITTEKDPWTCETRGVLGSTAGAIGSIQTIETIKMLTGFRPNYLGKLGIWDFYDGFQKTVDLGKRPDCPACGTGPDSKVLRPQLVWLCGDRTVNVNPQRALELFLGPLSHRLKARGFTILVDSPRMLAVTDPRGHELSIFRNGRMLVKNVESEGEARQVGESIQSVVSANASNPL